MSESWLWATAADLGRGIASGEIDPVALAECYLDAAEAHPLRDRIYARLTRERALAEARAAAERARTGLRRAPLDGVPISWKDLFDTAGLVTEAGSKMLAGRTPDKDALVLARGRRAGTVCLGKTHMTELAFSGLGLNPVTATPPNSVDPALAPGGSSSGAATSVGFGLAAAGIGSDTGGSVRIPAAWNDLVGLKTTHGLLPDDGIVILIESLDTAGPLCRSVEDAALLTAMMAGTRAPDLSGASIRGARLMVLETVALDDCQQAPLAAFEATVERLAAAGAVIERAAAPEVAEAMALSGMLFTAEAWAEWGETIEEKGHLMYGPVRERFRMGASVTAAEFIRGWRRLRALRESYLARTAGYDAVIMPTSPILPPDREALLADEDYFTRENLMALRNTRIGNLLGVCSLTLPTATPCCGFNLMGRPFEEGAILRLGAAIEALD